MAVDLGADLDNSSIQTLQAHPLSSVDIDDDDDASSVADSGFWELTPSTRSVASSIYDYEHAHGRTYHGYSQGAYVFPNDEAENERVEVFYHALRLALNNKLFYAPVAEPYHILDVGTGTGIWCIDVADAYPAANVIGTDLSPTQHTYMPPNCEFQIADADSAAEWDFSRTFDLIHTRVMIDMAVRSWPHFFQRAYENLSPGGWVECQEFDYHRRTDDNTIPENSQLKKWEQEWTRGINVLGLMGYCDPQKVELQMREAGLVNVHTLYFKLPVGPWAKDPTMKQAGLFSMVNLLDGMYGLSLKIFTDLLGYTEQQLQEFVAECHKEVRLRKVHSYYNVYVIMGQKPASDVDML